MVLECSSYCLSCSDNADYCTDCQPEDKRVNINNKCECSVGYFEYNNEI
jgi:hypothetical protein